MANEPIAWYDPSNGVVSTDQDCPLFTPLGQVWALYPKGEWVGLTDEDFYGQSELQVMAMKYAEAKLKEKNT
jgi:hypothetical protein